MATGLHEPEHGVIIAGVGPDGLMPAGELALGGIRPIVPGPLPGPSHEPKANGLIGERRSLFPERSRHRVAGLASSPRE
ncbi:hypothetical protein HGA13_05355 [Nocardia speluncae]|uniref:Uncharacterized protein n=1 Tax=Nocardia speluncae TaxID=419477 RepID=A0A846XF05_9NOCA|nr:hypothetical protein [Nocardia speluncae]NKY32504.1 hypothetical protein [Nocardia speluncae]